MRDLLENRPTIHDPTIEQFVYYARLVEGDEQSTRQARQRSFQDALDHLAAHLSRFCPNAMTWEFLTDEAHDPFLSQRLATLSWGTSSDQARAYLAHAYAYADAYLICVRYHRRGSYGPGIHARIQEELWIPPANESLLGSTVYFAGIAPMAGEHALAAQILRHHVPPRHGLGELQTCTFPEAHVFRGSRYPDLQVFLYNQQDAKQAVYQLLDHWLPIWGYHELKLTRQLTWFEDAVGIMAEQAAELEETLGSKVLENRADDWQVNYRDFQARLATCLRREHALQSNLESLRWLSGQMEPAGPDTLFATTLRALRARRQGITVHLVEWQRTRDTLAQQIASEPNSLSSPISLPRGDLSRLWLNSQRPQPVLADLASAAELGAWQSQGWSQAREIYRPAAGDAAPPWRGRRYHKFSLSISGPKTEAGYPLEITSVLGRFDGLIVPPVPDAHDRMVIDGEQEVASASEWQRLGQQLFASLITEERQESYRQALELARATSQGLRWQLSVEGAPELDQIPWECLYDPLEGAYLAASAETPLARYPSGIQHQPDEKLELPLRILFVTANPSDTESRFHLLPWSSQKVLDMIRASLDSMVERGIVRIQFVKQGTAAEICHANADFHPHIIQLWAHGVNRQGVEHLLLENQRNRGRLYTAQSFQGLFLEPSTRLLVLHPPATQPPSMPSIGWEMAKKMQRLASCAVIAFRRVLSTEAERAFVRRLAQNLAPGNMIDVALAETRRQLAEHLEDMEWAWPVLFLPWQPGQ